MSQSYDRPEVEDEISDHRWEALLRYRHDGPTETTEREAEDSAIQFLLAGLGVASLRELHAKVEFADAAMPLIAALAIYGEQVNVPALVEKAQALNHALVGVPLS